MHWSSTGWKRDKQRTLSDDDYAFAKSKGVMFDPIRLDHADALARLFNATARLTRRIVADAFLASLSTRRLDWRSAFGSYAVFQNLHSHTAESALRACAACGSSVEPVVLDLNVLNFELLKWGGVRHGDVHYAMLDLGIFLEEPIATPTAEDKRIFRDILSSINDAPAKVSSASLHHEFATCLKSNKAERDVIVAILGYCGILATPEHPGFSDSFIQPASRKLPDRHFVDMLYPACWWRREICLNLGKVEEYFAHVL
ncbi:MAG TPA: hypothetical protein DCW29_21470 [Janthinobacterium sp.]|nr:hypothetical protein [Janthinobacterium sp.]